MSTKLLVVTGATGQQGGSVARRLSKNPEWRVRAVTRNPNSEAAKALASSGIEVVKGDNGDLDSLIKAFEVRSIVQEPPHIRTLSHISTYSRERTPSLVLPISGTQCSRTQTMKNAARSKENMPSIWPMQPVRPQH